MATTFTNLRVYPTPVQNFPTSSWTFGSTETTVDQGAGVTITLNTNGTTSVAKDADDETLINTTTNWYTPTTTNIGTSYWVQATLVSGSAATSGTFGSRLQLNSARAWNWSTTTAVGVKSGTVKFDFYDASTGGNLVGSVNATFTVTPGAVGALDIPEFIIQSVWTANTTAISVPPPGAYINDDLLLLVLTSTNQTISAPSTGGPWTQVANSPQGTGTAGAAQSIATAVYYKIASGAQANVDVADSGVLTTGQMFSIRKVNTSTPIQVTAGSVLATAGTTHTFPAVTTTTANTMIAHCAGIGRDAALTVNYSSPVNANLSNLTVQTSSTTSSANGGGIGLVTGVKSAAGSTGTTSVTVAGSAKGAFITTAIAPSSNYDSTTRAIGCYGYASSFASYFTGFDAISFITLETNGTITALGGQAVYLPFGTKWVNNPSTGVGNNYWVRATTNFLIGSGTGTTGSWLQLNTARTWTLTAPTGGAIYGWDIKFEFATDSAGTNIVATTNFSLQSETEFAPTVSTVGTVGGIIP